MSSCLFFFARPYSFWSTFSLVDIFFFSHVVLHTGLFLHCCSSWPDGGARQYKLLSRPVLEFCIVISFLFVIMACFYPRPICNRLGCSAGNTITASNAGSCPPRRIPVDAGDSQRRGDARFLGWGIPYQSADNLAGERWLSLLFCGGCLFGAIVLVGIGMGMCGCRLSWVYDASRPPVGLFVTLHFTVRRLYTAGCWPLLQRRDS